MGGFFGGGDDFVERGLVFDARFEGVTEADFFADFDPVILTELGHFGEGGFAEVFEVIAPDARDGGIVVVPEFAFVSGAVGGDGGVAGMDGVGFAVFVEEVGETDFDEDVVFGDVVLEIFFVLNDGVFEGDAVGTDKVGVDDEMVFGVGVADGGLRVPDFASGGGASRHTGDNGGDNNDYEYKNADNSKNFFHVAPLLFW